MTRQQSPLRRGSRAGALALCLWAGACSANSWQLSLQDADIRDVVREVGDILQQTIILDPRVQGRVTVLSSDQLDSEGVRSLFYSVLNAQGFAAVNDGERLLVIPASEAKAWANQSVAGVPAGFATEVFELTSASAADLAGLLRPLVSSHGYIGPSASANALVISDSVGNLERLASLVAQLDAGQQHDYALVHLQHAAAHTLVALVEAAAGRGDAAGKVLADTRGNRVLVLGPPRVRARLERLVQAFDTPTPAAAHNWRVLRLHHADAVQLAQVLGEVGKGLDQPAQAKATTDDRQPAMISADESQNALVLVAEPQRLQALEQIVAQLDQPRAQVLIHAAIVEVSGDISQALGVQWGLQSGSASGVINFPAAGLDVAGFLAGKDVAVNGAALALGTDRFAVLVSALASDTRSNLLSTPSLLTLDNQSAEILVGQNVPFKTGSYTTSGSGADNPFTTVERKDVGISLKIRPHINDTSSLRLEVEQESSEIAPGLEGSDLITNKRALKSTILAEDGQIIVIGGLIKDSLRTERSEVPLLGRLPWVGGLFRWSRDTQVKTNLMVFLRPTIIRSHAALAAQSRQRYQQVRQANPEGPLAPDPQWLFDPVPALVRP